MFKYWLEWFFKTCLSQSGMFHYKGHDITSAHTLEIKPKNSD